MKKQATIVFLCAFFMIFVIGLQTRTIAEGKAIQAGILSMFISMMWLVSVTSVIKKGTICKIAYVIGGSIGSASSVVFYEMVMK